MGRLPPEAKALRRGPPTPLNCTLSFIKLVQRYVALGLLALPAASRGSQYLINAPQNSLRNGPAYIRDHFAHIESLPFDGMTINTPSTTLVMKNTTRSYQAMSNDFAPLNGLTFTRLKHNFAAVSVDRPADFFDDWSVAIANFRTLARVLKERGIEGIFFDNEEYRGRLFNYPDDCSYQSKSLTEYQTQARLRGKQVMEAIAAEFPEIVFMVYHGPYAGFSGTPSNVAPGQLQPSLYELQAAFSVGLIEGMDSLGRFVDGGELYGNRTVADFQNAYDFRKTGMASAAVNCPFIPTYLRPVWPQKVSISYGFYNYGWPSGMTMDPGIMRTTLERALRRCDDYVWIYFEDLNWNAPGEIPEAWVDAIVGARAAASTPAVNAPPSVVITSPKVGVTYGKPVTITISATASDADGGSVGKVEFFSDTTKLGEDPSAPYTFAWVDPPVGSYSLTAKATDNGGATTISAAVNITVGASFSANVNFQPTSVTAQVGYLADTGNVYGSRGDGLTYGWNVSHAANTRDQEDSWDRRKATLCRFQSGGVWEIAVPNASYIVTVGIGDGSYSSTHTINVEGVNYWSAQGLGAGAFANKTKSITVSDGRLTINQGGAGAEATRIDYVLIAPSGAPPAAPSALWAAPSSADGSSVNLIWADNSSTESGFELQRSTSASFVPATLIATLGADTASYPQSGLAGGVTYYYRVRAINGGVTSAYSNVTTATPALADTDGDGIPDSQEVSPYVVGVDDRLIDSDRDGVSNAAEYAAATNPFDSRSLLQFAQATLTSAGGSAATVTLWFQTVAGRKYYVDYTEFLDGDVWTLVPGSNRAGDGTLQSVTDTSNSMARFYRLRVSRSYPAAGAREDAPASRRPRWAP